jgi:hypothetical protein
MPDAPQTTLAPADAARAVFYGQFVAAAYTMYGNDPSNPAPAPVSLPGNYEFVAWVQMRDFIFEAGNWTFYGLIAQNPSAANDFVLAIRGTQDLTEWWDDLTSMVPVPMPGFGSAGYGFQRIYQTLRVVKYLGPPAAGAASPAQTLQAAGSFADQVAATIHAHAAGAPRAGEDAAPPPLQSINVIGHSLGSALATLYVAQNAVTPKVATPLICTFASPRVGDYTFKTKFDGLGITSWRIVNELDLVPKLPFLDFWHVDVEYLYNSGSSTVWSPGCWHSLNTYLHLLDPKQPLLPSCVWPQPAPAAVSFRPAPTPRFAAAAAAPGKEIALAVPSDHGTTINITITVGKSD